MERTSTQPPSDADLGGDAAVFRRDHIATEFRCALCAPAPRRAAWQLFRSLLGGRNRGAAYLRKPGRDRARGSDARTLARDARTRHRTGVADRGPRDALDCGDHRRARPWTYIPGAEPDGVAPHAIGGDGANVGNLHVAVRYSRD